MYGIDSMPDPVAPEATGVDGSDLSASPMALSQVQREFIKQFVDRRWSALKLLREPREKEWADAMLAYRVKRVRSFYNGRSQLILPVASVIVERIVPNIVNQTVGRGEFFDARAKSAGAERKAKINVALLHNQLEDDNFRAKYGAFIRETCILGAGIWKSRWTKVVRRVMVPTRVEEPIGMGPNGFVMRPVMRNEWREVTLANRPGGCRVNPFRVWYDHMVEDEDDTDWVEEQYVTGDWLIQRAKSGLFDPAEVAKALAAGPGNQPAQSYNEARLDRAAGAFDPAAARTRDRFQYVEFYGKIPVSLQEGDEQKGETQEYVCGIVNKQFVVWAQTNPRAFQDKPYRVNRIMPIAGSLEGVSVLSINMSLIIEKNDKRNQALDNSTLANNPMLLDIGGNADKQSYRAGPGKVLHAAGDTLKPFVLPDMAGGLYRDQAILDRDIEEAAGAPPLLSGQQQPGVGSATEFAGLTQNATTQVIKYAHAVEDTFLKRTLTQYHRLNQQFLPRDVAIRMVGEDGLDFLSIQREDTLVDLEFLITGASSMQSKAMLGAQWGVLLPQIVQIEMLQPGNIDIQAILGRIFKDVFAFDHPELYVRGAKRSGPVRSPEEVFLLLTQGVRLIPDPRADLYEQLKALGSFVVAYGNQISPPCLANALEYVEQATIALQQQIAAALQAQTMMALQAKPAAGPAGPAATGNGKGGGANQPDGGTDRDGKGTTEGRQHMKAMRPQGQGA